MFSSEVVNSLFGWNSVQQQQQQQKTDRDTVFKIFIIFERKISLEMNEIMIEKQMNQSEYKYLGKIVELAKNEQKSNSWRELIMQARETLSWQQALQTSHHRGEVTSPVLGDFPLYS